MSSRNNSSLPHSQDAGFNELLFSIVGKGSLKFYVPFCFSLAKAAKFQKWRSRQSFSPDILGSEVRLRSPQRSQVRDPAQASGRKHRPGGFVTGRNRTLDFTRLYSDIWVKMRSNDEVIHLGLIASSLATSEHPKIPDFHGDSIKQLSDYPGKSLFSMGKLTIKWQFSIAMFVYQRVSIPVGSVMVHPAGTREFRVAQRAGPVGS